MLQKLLIVVPLAWLAVVPASGQETPASAPASQPAQETPTGTPGDEAASWEQMTVEELLGRAELFLAAGQAREAALVLTLVRQKDLGNLKAKVLAGEVAETQGDMNTARKLYLEVLAAESSNFRANLNMGKAWVRARHWHQAKRYLERAAAVAPDAKLSAEVQANLAIAYQGTYEREEAMKAARKAVADDPENLDARQVLIALHMGREEYDQAMINAEQLVAAADRTAQREPSNEAALRTLSGTYTIQVEVLKSFQQTLYEVAADGRYTDRLLPGQQRQAAETLRRIIDLTILQTNLTRTLTYHRILELARMRVQYAPNDTHALMQYGLLLLETAYNERAIQVFQAVLEKDPNNAEAQRQLEALGATPASQPALEGTGGEQPGP
jgi:tetratricopeptide (TPR) repeat protein